jgi:hypothetical protein
VVFVSGVGVSDGLDEEDELAAAELLAAADDVAAGDVGEEDGLGPCFFLTGNNGGIAPFCAAIAEAADTA